MFEGWRWTVKCFVKIKCFGCAAHHYVRMFVLFFILESFSIFHSNFTSVWWVKHSRFKLPFLQSVNCYLRYRRNVLLTTHSSPVQLMTSLTNLAAVMWKIKGRLSEHNWFFWCRQTGLWVLCTVKQTVNTRLAVDLIQSVFRASVWTYCTYYSDDNSGIFYYISDY